VQKVKSRHPVAIRASLAQSVTDEFVSTRGSANENLGGPAVEIRSSVTIREAGASAPIDAPDMFTKQMPYLR
jgi:hypothetical protein